MNCLHCGAPVLINNVCSECGLKQEYLIRAWNTSLYYYNEGLSKAKNRDLAGAEEALKTSLRYSKLNIDARNLLGLVYYESGQVVEALMEWVISSNYQAEENPAVRYLKLVQGNQNKLSAYDQAAKKYNLTLHYVKQKQDDLALIQLKRILSSNPHFVNAYLLLALVYMRAGSMEKAKKALQRVLKIDRYNPRAQEYLDAIDQSEKQHGYSSYEADEDDASDLPPMDADGESGWESEKELDGEETAKRKIREIIERGAAAEDVGQDSNLEIGSYQEIKYGKHNVLYLCAGLVLGVAAMFFLIMPNRIKEVRNENLQLKSSYSAELASKNEQIANMQEKADDLQTKIDELQGTIGKMNEANNGTSLDNNLLTALQAYMTGDREAAIAALGSVDLSNTELSESARACAQTVVDNCADILDPYRSAGMTAFSAENYAEAITQLKVYCNLKPDDVEARYNLASAYKSTGDLASANALFDDINKRFPDSEYANRDENASTESDTSGSTESGTEAGGTTSTEHTMPEE